MSKQSERKLAQGYEKSGPACCGCKHYASDMVESSCYGYDNWLIEKNIRCSIGNFAVLKRGWCKLYESAAS